MARAQRRLLAQALRARRGRVDLLLDEVMRGASAQRAGTVCLALGLAMASVHATRRLRALDGTTSGHERTEGVDIADVVVRNATLVRAGDIPLLA